MSLLDKIIYIADFIEPMRSKASNLPVVRRLAYEDLDMAVFVTLRDTLHYLKNSSSLDQRSIEAYNYYKRFIREREE